MDELTTVLWEAAREHLRKLDGQYAALLSMRGVNVNFVRFIIIAPLAERYDQGERTPGLYKEMLEVE